MDTREKIRNIVIVGRTGSGKSTLANVLSDTDYFEENNYSCGKTKDFKEKIFEYKGTKYRVVDTPGISIAKNKISKTVKEISSKMPKEISQVLFVVDEKFTREEIQAFELLRKDIFNSGIAKFITIVRTKFFNFKNDDESRIDKIELFMENKIIANIVKSCRGIVYVDNLPTNISPNDDDDRKRIEINRKRREKSRTILLDHLEEVCQKGNFKLKHDERPVPRSKFRMMPLFVSRSKLRPVEESVPRSKFRLIPPFMSRSKLRPVEVSAPRSKHRPVEESGSVSPFMPRSVSLFVPRSVSLFVPRSVSPSVPRSETVITVKRTLRHQLETVVSGKGLYISIF